MKYGDGKTPKLIIPEMKYEPKSEDDTEENVEEATLEVDGSEAVEAQDESLAEEAVVASTVAQKHLEETEEKNEEESE